MMSSLVTALHRRRRHPTKTLEACAAPFLYLTESLLGSVPGPHSIPPRRHTRHSKKSTSHARVAFITSPIELIGRMEPPAAPPVFRRAVLELLPGLGLSVIQAEAVVKHYSIHNRYTDETQSKTSSSSSQSVSCESHALRMHTASQGPRQ